MPAIKCTGCPRLTFAPYGTLCRECHENSVRQATRMGDPKRIPKIVDMRPADRNYEREREKAK